MILAKQTGCFAPGCKFNVESTDVLLPLSAIKRRTNSSHPLCGWQLTRNTANLFVQSVNRKRGLSFKARAFHFSSELYTQIGFDETLFMASQMLFYHDRASLIQPACL
jgi:hypothetical protein